MVDSGNFSGVPETIMAKISAEFFSSWEDPSCQSLFQNSETLISSAKSELTENESCSTLASQSLSSNLKIGSLQEFIQSKGPIENFSHSMFDKEEVHKIGVLDFRILNLDRNVCNILVQAKKHPNCSEIECYH